MMQFMKTWIEPPIQVMLWVAGLVCIGLACWQLLLIKGLDETPAAGAGIHIPDIVLPAVPDTGQYPQMVAAPLFWESRTPAAAVVAAAGPVPPEAPVLVDATPPEGRLTGIIAVGSNRFALMQDNAGISTRLEVGDHWGAWEVDDISTERITLKLDGQQQVIPLIADFVAPQANPSVVTARQQQAARQPPPPVAAAPAAIPVPASAPPAPLQPQPLAVEEPAAPPLSPQDALEARQRLMASRWGALTGEAAQTLPPAANGQ